MMMHPAKRANVLKLDGAARHDYFVRKVADAQCVWGLNQSGWALVADRDGRKHFPFWPEEGFAQACAVGEWVGYVPLKIEVEEFIEKWLPGLQRDGFGVAVFPTPGDRGVIVEPRLLRKSLEIELAKYE
jgi:hypothetical protein